MDILSILCNVDVVEEEVVVVVVVVVVVIKASETLAGLSMNEIHHAFRNKRP